MNYSQGWGKSRTVLHLADVSGFEPPLAVSVVELLGRLFRHVVVALGDVESADDDLAAGSYGVGDSVAAFLPVDELDVDPVERGPDPTCQ